MALDRARPALSSLDVLIVEDHGGMRQLLARVLKAAGAMSVREAADGVSALALLSERPAGLILVDQHMPQMTGPQMTGVEFVRQVRPAPNGAATLIIMLSGTADQAFADAAHAAGANAVLVKPVSPRALIERIAMVMRADKSLKSADRVAIRA